MKIRKRAKRNKKILKGKKGSQLPVVEILVNPFCLGRRDVDTVSEVCSKYGIKLHIYNLWDIMNNNLTCLPLHIASLIKEWRSGQRPGTVYSSVFVNSKRIPLNNWSEHLKTVGKEIASCVSKDDSL